MGHSTTFVLLLTVLVVSALAILLGLFLFNIWFSKNAQGRSPYTGLPLRRATDLSYSSAEKVLRYLYNYHQYDNRIFKLRKAVFCRDTGRIFQDCVTWYNTVDLDWSFLQKRYPGHYVSWGSLNREQQEAVRDVHLSLEGFQTEMSSPTPSPRMVEKEYAFTRPGPLYVDIETKVLLGWKIVPNTDLEVLIVQKPIK